VFGLIIFKDLALGLALGMCLGLAVGTAFGVGFKRTGEPENEGE
jgi:hypothetical protein